MEELVTGMKKAREELMDINATYKTAQREGDEDKDSTGEALVASSTRRR